MWRWVQTFPRCLGLAVAPEGARRTSSERGSDCQAFWSHSSRWVCASLKEQLRAWISPWVSGSGCLGGRAGFGGWRQRSPDLLTSVTRNL